jgi:putative endonuclease
VSAKHLELGRAGEDAALDVYLDRGFDLVVRNWRCPLGEIDLIVTRDGVIVFCEVKTRRGTAFGGGYEAVTALKRSKLRRLAEMFLLGSHARDAIVRLDVASVMLRDGQPPSVELFEDAF